MSNRSVNIGVGLDTNGIATGVQQVQGQMKQLNAEVRGMVDQLKGTTQEAAQGFKKVGDSSGIAGAAVMSFNGIIQDSSYGIRGIANNLQQFTVMMIGLVSQTKSVKLAFVELRNVLLGPLGILLAITSVITWMERQSMQSKKTTEETDKNKAATEGLSATLKYAKQIRETYNDSLAETKALMVDVNRLSKEQISLELAELRKQLISETQGLAMAEQALDDARQEQLATNWKGKAATEAINNEVKDATKAFEQYKGKVDAVSDAVKAYQEALAKMSGGGAGAVKKGIFEQMVMKSRGGLDDFKNMVSEASDAARKLPEQLEPIMFNAADAVTEYLQRTINNWEQMRMRLNDMIKLFVVDSVSGFLGAIGQSITGGKDAIKQFGQDFLGQFGGFLQQVGAMILTYGFAMEAFKNAFKNPITTIAAGAALIVIGGAIKGAHEKKFGKSAGGSGGVSGGYGGGSGSYNSQLQDNIIYSRLDGRDLVLSNQRTGYSNGR